jgi:hypothetical protein
MIDVVIIPTLTGLSMAIVRLRAKARSRARCA